MAQSERNNVTHMDAYKQSALRPDAAETLKSGGGDGTFDDMLRRVEALEKGFERIESKIDTMKTDVAEIKGQLKAMPTTIQLLLAVVAIFTASGLLRYFGH